ncbi:MAG TPA: heme-binding protein [Ilumatobacteraceae bacterium]|nr:heme-binding protein [Ilumatobacteraceae bacterium]
MNDLSHHDAQRVLASAQAELDRTGRGAAVAVVDHHGELIAFVRTDGCRLPSISIAINKASATLDMSGGVEASRSSSMVTWSG